MANPNCMYCQGTGFRNNGYYQYFCQCNQPNINIGILPQIDGTILKGITPYEETLKLNKKKAELFDTVIKFMKEQDITCEETIHQIDSVIENAYDFISDLFNIVKEDLDIEEDDE